MVKVKYTTEKGGTVLYEYPSWHEAAPFLRKLFEVLARTGDKGKFLIQAGAPSLANHPLEASQFKRFLRGKLFKSEKQGV